MSILLTSDLHLTDAPLEGYRWRIFDTLRDLIKQKRIDRLFILGDLTDRKDRHSGSLVNALMDGLQSLPIRPFILKGNHDQPLSGVPFWDLLNFTDVAVFISKPTRAGIQPDASVLFLPFEHNPAELWSQVDFSGIRTVFMHQTIEGAIGNNGFRIEGDKLPLLPRRLKIYSGDIHTPQRLGNIDYVGSPYPIKFGDTYKTRMLLLNDDMDIIQEIPIDSIRKAILTISNVNDLDRFGLRSGDQARVHYNLSSDDVQQWPRIKDEIREWAYRNMVSVLSIDTMIQMPAISNQRTTIPTIGSHDPRDIFHAFCRYEQLSGELIRGGLEYLDKYHANH